MGERKSTGKSTKASTKKKGKAAVKTKPAKASKGKGAPPKDAPAPEPQPPMPPAESPKMGRPTIYSQEVADKFLDLIIEGKTLRVICDMEGMPSKTTVLRWMDRFDFRTQYAHARELQAHVMEDEIVEISDDTTQDTLLGESGLMPNTEWIMRSRLRVDTRKWLMGKRLAAFRDKIAFELPDGGGGVILPAPVRPKPTSDAGQ